MEKLSILDRLFFVVSGMIPATCSIPTPVAPLSHSLKQQARSHQQRISLPSTAT